MSATAVKTNGRARVPRVSAAPEPPSARPAGSQLMAAILAVQAAAPKLIRDTDGRVGPRTYKYVTLDAVVDAVLPLLTEHELVWSAYPTTDDLGQPAIRYQLFHVPSGESEQDVMSLMCATPDPQGQGSALTYARRYALLAVLNLTTGEDDDGAAASGQTHAEVQSQPSARPPRPPDRPASAKQRSMLQAKAREAQLEPDVFANVILAAAGEEPRTWASQEAVQGTLGRLLDRLPARLVDAVIEGIEGSA